MTLSSDHKALVERLHAEADRLDRQAFSDRCVSPDCALASNLASEASSALLRLEAERDAALRLEAEHWSNLTTLDQARLAAEARAIAAERREKALEEALRGTLAALVAITSIVIRAEDEKKQPSKVVASDTMFRQMLKDYDNATIAARAALAGGEKREAIDVLAGMQDDEIEQELLPRLRKALGDTP